MFKFYRYSYLLDTYSLKLNRSDVYKMSKLKGCCESKNYNIVYFE